MNNFVWNRRWTFRVRTGRPMLQAARFLAVSGAVLVLTLAAMSVLVGSGGMGRLPAEAVATAAMTPLSFAGARLWAFATDRPRNLAHLGAHVVS
jgi:putative flippase GtrA